MRDSSIIGRSPPRVDVLDKALGSEIYGYDMNLPAMLHAKAPRSKVRYAEIVSIDTEEIPRKQKRSR